MVLRYLGTVGLKKPEEPFIVSTVSMPKISDSPVFGFVQTEPEKGIKSFSFRVDSSTTRNGFHQNMGRSYHKYFQWRRQGSKRSED
jgi:hypothetical protein